MSHYCAAIHGRYENNPLFGRHLDSFINSYGFSPRKLAEKILDAFSDENNPLPPFNSPSDPNTERKALILPLISSINARKHLLELQKGYIVTSDDADTLLYKGFSKETAKAYIDSFEKFLNDNKDSIEALRIIYNSEDTVITHSMLMDLQDKLLMENRQFSVDIIWKNYKTLDGKGEVDDLNTSANVKALTNLIQLVRYAFKKAPRLVSIFSGYTQRFNLYCGQNQRTLTQDQQEIMKQIAEYIINDGAIDDSELNEINTDLWRTAVKGFGIPTLRAEMQSLSKFLLKAA